MSLTVVDLKAHISALLVENLLIRGGAVPPRHSLKVEYSMKKEFHS